MMFKDDELWKRFTALERNVDNLRSTVRNQERIIIRLERELRWKLNQIKK